MDSLATHVYPRETMSQSSQLIYGREEETILKQSSQLIYVREEETMSQSSRLIHGREESVIDIRSDLPPAERPEFCIYKVPKQLREVKDQAYTPKQVSIGPFHRNLRELKGMEKHKRKYLEDFLKRVTEKKSQQDFERIIEAKEKEIRHCYSEDDPSLKSDKFVKMILLDAIFIIELFLKVNSINEARKKGEKAEEEKNDYILSKPWMANGICYDLILLENQLPFFVLEDLYTSAFNDSSGLSYQQEGQQIKEHQGDLNKEDTPFLKLSRGFFSYYDKHEESNIGGEVKHFTDLLRYFFCSPKPKPTGYQYSIYSATKLDEAGLQFKAAKDDRRLFDITFQENKCLKSCPCFNLSWLLACLPCFKCFSCLERMQCILEVPRFVVDDHTECLLRNIMALEQCYYPRQAYICNYVRLLDYLINTEEDVALLVDEKVIINELGSNVVVANLINNLCDEIVLDGTCYSSLAKELNDYRDNPWNRNMASMTSVYFRDFWRGTTTVVGLIVLGLTVWNFFK